MRLNFSGVDEDEIREGIRRIGEVVREQVELYGTLTGVAPAGRRADPEPPGRRGDPEPAGKPASEPEAPAADVANVLQLRRRRA
ncbi:MAG: hypothetical protein JO046_17955, partial [Solirubrobacterales bacterium]|nr:hypothetical protein [Solirubrobacterales bacterium]